MARKKETAQSIKKKQTKISTEGKVYVTATFNNTLITVSDNNDKVVAWGSAGASGFQGARKSTPYAATMSVQNVADRIKERGMQKVDVFVKGVGLGRDAAIRAIRAAGLDITSISDISPMPHNGCRPPKRRRV